MANNLTSVRNEEFTKNAMEAAIRIGLVVLWVGWCFQILRPFVIPIIWGVIIAVAIYPIYEYLRTLLKDSPRVSATLVTVRDARRGRPARGADRAGQPARREALADGVPPGRAALRPHEPRAALNRCGRIRSTLEFSRRIVHSDDRAGHAGTDRSRAARFL